MGQTAGIALILNKNVFALLFLIVLLVSFKSGFLMIRKYKNAFATNWIRFNKEKSTNDINPGLFGFVITFVVLVTLLLVGHFYIGILTDAELIFAIIVVGFYGILFVILVWLSTKMECISPSQNACFPGSYVQTESGSSR